MCDRIRVIADSLRLFNPLLAKRFENCGTDAVTLECKGCKHRHTVSISCNLRICDVCTKRRWGKLNAKYAPLIRSKNPNKLSLLTLTVRNTPTLDRKAIRTLLENFMNFRRRSYVEKRMHGGMAVVEVKGTRGNFNMHFHIIASHNWFGRPSKYEVQNLKIPERLKETKGISSKKDLLNYSGKDVGQLLLSILWENLTKGESPVIDIRRIRSAKEAFKYVLKYVTKPPALKTPEDMVEFVIGFYSLPMIILFGDFYHSVVLVMPRLICVMCGRSDWKIVWFTWQLLNPDIEIRAP